MEFGVSIHFSLHSAILLIVQTRWFTSPSMASDVTTSTRLKRRVEMHQPSSKPDQWDWMNRYRWIKNEMDKNFDKCIYVGRWIKCIKVLQFYLFFIFFRPDFSWLVFYCQMSTQTDRLSGLAMLINRLRLNYFLWQNLPLGDFHKHINLSTFFYQLTRR